jgi:hypothetical protein
MTLEERFAAIMKHCEHLRAQNEERTNRNAYLGRQLGESMKQKGKEIRSSTSSHSSQSAREGGNEEEPHSGGSSCGEEPLRHPRRGRRHYSNLNDIRVEVPEFEGDLDPDEFLEWLQIVERVFERKGIAEDKKVKLIAPKLRKFAFLWWTNLLVKRARQGKEKIRTWDKMKSKLKARFLPPTYLQNNYSQPPHLIQAYTTFDEVRTLAYKVEQPMKTTKTPKREFANPLPKGQPFNKGSPSYPSKPVTPSTPFLQKGQAPQNSQPPQNGPNPDPITPRSCFKCQGLGHIASECPNRKIISLPKWEDNKEKENHKVCLMEEQEKVVEDANEGGQPFATNEVGKNEGDEVNFDLPQRIEEHEDQQDNDNKGACEAIIISGCPQKLEVKRAEITQGFERHLIREECPYHQQELGTILFQQGEYDGYLLGHSIRPCETNSFEVTTSYQIPASVDPSPSPLFEFQDKRHFMEVYLNFKIPFLSQVIQQAETGQFLPGFVVLVENDPEGESACTPHPLLA